MYYYRIWITGFWSPRRIQLTVRLSDTLSFLVCRSCSITHVGSDNRCSRTHQRLATQRAEHRRPSTVLLPDMLHPYPRASETGQARLTKGVMKLALISWWILEDNGSDTSPAPRRKGTPDHLTPPICFVSFCFVLFGVCFYFSSGIASKKSKC